MRHKDTNIIMANPGNLSGYERCGFDCFYCFEGIPTFLILHGVARSYRHPECDFDETIGNGAISGKGHILAPHEQ